MMASRCCPRLKVTSVTPRRERSLSSATFIGPGEGCRAGRWLGEGGRHGSVEGDVALRPRLPT
jgi:hypothetical protein